MPPIPAGLSAARRPLPLLIAPRGRLAPFRSASRTPCCRTPPPAHLRRQRSPTDVPAVAPDRAAGRRRPPSVLRRLQSSTEPTAAGGSPPHPRAARRGRATPAPRNPTARRVVDGSIATTLPPPVTRGGRPSVRQATHEGRHLV